MVVGVQSPPGCRTMRRTRGQKIMESTREREACALLQMLEQLRQLLTDCVAVPAGPGSVGHAHEASRASDSTERESKGDTMNNELDPALDIAASGSPYV